MVLRSRNAPFFYLVALIQNAFYYLQVSGLVDDVRTFLKEKTQHFAVPSF